MKRRYITTNLHGVKSQEMGYLHSHRHEDREFYFQFAYSGSDRQNIFISRIFAVFENHEKV